MSTESDEFYGNGTICLPSLDWNETSVSPICISTDKIITIAPEDPVESIKKITNKKHWYVIEVMCGTYLVASIYPWEEFLDRVWIQGDDDSSDYEYDEEPSTDEEKFDAEIVK